VLHNFCYAFLSLAVSCFFLLTFLLRLAVASLPRLPYFASPCFSREQSSLAKFATPGPAYFTRGVPSPTGALPLLPPGLATADACLSVPSYQHRTTHLDTDAGWPHFPGTEPTPCVTYLTLQPALH
jgi:hypothetical protein